MLSTSKCLRAYRGAKTSPLKGDALMTERSVQGVRVMLRLGLLLVITVYEF